MNWQEKAIEILESSLYPVASELNELDWKGGLSDKTSRLAQHISAFSNIRGGGLLVYGVNDDATFSPLSKEEMERTLKTLGNIAHNNLSTPIQLEHAVLDYKGNALLFVHIPEQTDKPIHLRGKDLFEAYTRSAGQTVKMSRSQVKSLIADSQDKPFERRICKTDVSTEEMLQLLNFRKLYELQGKNLPTNASVIASHLEEYGYCIRHGNDWDITNMGAILLANDISNFSGLRSHTVIVRKYISTNNRELLSEQRGAYGYAVGFEGLIDYIMKLTSIEQIDVVRQATPTYPRKAVREFVANALIHQDFSIEGMQVIIEIFSNRLSITNPGPPLNDIIRLIDLPPHSRNEVLAETMYLLGMCEKRGSGIDRAIEAIEKAGLPAPHFAKSEVHTRVTLYPKKSWKDMNKQERISACYQHACLMFEDNKAINNQSVRERFKLDKNNSAVASKIISDTVDSGLIKQSNEDSTSRKFATYIPFYG